MKRIKRIKLKLPLYVDPNVVEPRKFAARTQRYYVIPGRGFTDGNTHSRPENMSEEANARRVAGAMAGWANRHKAATKRIAIMGKVARRQQSLDIKRGLRNKVRLTVAKEARDIQEMARKSAAQAMEVAREIMANGAERASDRLAAANFITERAYGKATQTNVNAQVDANGSPKEVSGKELDKRIEETLRRVEAVTGRTSKPAPSSQRPVNVRKRHRNPSGTTVH